MSREPEQSSACPTAAHQVYPAVDFSRYPLRRGLITPSFSRYCPTFRASDIRGSKRLCRDGGASYAATAATTITSTSELLAALAGCRSSSPSSSISARLVDPDQIISRSRTGLEVEAERDGPPEESSQDGDTEDDWAAGGDELVEQGGAGADPIEVLATAVFEIILGSLDWRSLGACLAVSGAWNKCAKANLLWDAACKQMWEGKINVISSFSNDAICPLQAFLNSMAEAQRVRIESGDLCGWVWEHHYKKGVGEYWRQLDPYYHGLPLMRRIFHQDGYVSANPMDQIWGGHECSWTLRNSKSKGGAPLVQINHWPPLVVTRTSNWGWKMENAWVVYASTNIPTRFGQTRQQQREPISDRGGLVAEH